MVGAMPVLLAAAAALFARRRDAGPLRLAGPLSASTVGAALIALGGSRGPAAHGEPTLIGDLLVVVSLVTALAWILLSKKLMQTHSPPVVTAYTILSGTVMLAVWVLGPWLLNPVHPRTTSRRLPFAHVSLHRLDGAGHQRPALHGNDHAVVELGHPPRAGLARRSLPEYRAALGSWLGVKLLGEHLGPYAWVGRRADPGGGRGPDHARPSRVRFGAGHPPGISLHDYRCAKPWSREPRRLSVIFPSA